MLKNFHFCPPSSDEYLVELQIVPEQLFQNPDVCTFTMLHYLPKDEIDEVGAQILRGI